MPRSRADISNTALRIFLAEMGAAYDQERSLPPFKTRAHFGEVVEFFGGRCCFCDVEFDSATKPVQDHLIPTNRTGLGLHAWGNIVPACRECNATKQGRDWRDFIIPTGPVSCS